MRLRVLGCLLLCLLSYGCGYRWQPKETEGLYIYTVNGKYGFTGRLNGSNVTLEAKFDFLAPYSEGLAVAELHGKQGYIGFDGEWAIQPIFIKAYPFSEGLARVVVPGSLGIGRKFGYIDHEGYMVLSAKYDNATDFLQGTARVRVGGQRWAIDRLGNPLSSTTNLIFKKRKRNF